MRLGELPLPKPWTRSAGWPGKARFWPRAALLSLSGLGRRPADSVSAAARAAAQRTPETLTVVRQRAQPTAVTIARLAGTAVFAYLLALQLPGSSRPVLAPLTALLVVQVTLYQAIRSAIRRVVSVVAGVLVAVGLAAAVGFTWWSLGITIAAALALGYVLHLGGEILEVPISAMLILSVDTRSAATSRIIETLVGAAPARSGAWTVLSARPRRASGSIPDACCSRAWGSACSAHWKSWSARHSRSGAWHARWPTALAWRLTTALCETPTFGPVSPWCYGS